MATKRLVDWMVFIAASLAYSLRDAALHASRQVRLGEGKCEIRHAENTTYIPVLLDLCQQNGRTWSA